MNATLMQAGRMVLTTVAGLLLLVVTVLVFRTVFAVGSAEAASDISHPTFCLGGWENPKNASGEPDAQGRTSYGAANSAYLAPHVSAQIFCGYFPVTIRDKSPLSTRITFSWSFVGVQAPKVAPDQVVEPVPTPSEEEPAPPEEEAPIETPVEEPPSVETPTEPAPEPAPEEPTPVEEPEAPAPEEPSAFLQEVLAHAFSTPIASAAEPSYPAFDLLDVSYSFDGVRWYSAGRVNMQNWNEFTITIPATTWEELQNVQVMVAALPSLEERPPIYLESIALKVDVDRTLSEVAGDSAAAALGALDGVLAVTDSLQNAVVGLFVPQPVPEAPAPAPAPPAPPAKIKVLSFKLPDDPISVTKERFPSPKVEVSSSGLSLTVKGACTQSYFVVLTYKNAADVVDKPRSFVSNYAGVCEVGSFSYAMEHLPVDTPEGTYYLVIAQQGEEGSWTLASSVMPVDISHTEVDPTPAP